MGHRTLSGTQLSAARPVRKLGVLVLVVSVIAWAATESAATPAALPQRLGRIAFIRLVNGPVFGGRLFVVRPDGTGLRQVTLAVRTPVVKVRPAVVRLGQSATIVVRAAKGSQGFEVRLEGSTTAIGLLSPWFRLRRHGGVWTVRVPPLELRGVYPLELREWPRRRVVRSWRWLYEVLAIDTLGRPSFATPEGVARDWVRRRGTLRAARRWPFSTRDHRLPTFQQRLVVAYIPSGDPSPSDRLGAFITAVRVSFGGRWRLLEATVRP
jgi:hypothetical protein